MIFEILIERSKGCQESSGSYKTEFVLDGKTVHLNPSGNRIFKKLLTVDDAMNDDRKSRVDSTWKERYMNKTCLCRMTCCTINSLGAFFNERQIRVFRLVTLGISFSRDLR